MIRNVYVVVIFISVALPLAGEELDRAARATYGPLLTASWNQFEPYYDRCPMDPKPEEDGSYSRCLVGCVALAFSEIFNYYRIPEWFTFTSADNYVTETRGIKITATDANCSGLNYNRGNPDAATRAKICFASGVLL
jgi:hypothetical protein